MRLTSWSASFLTFGARRRRPGRRWIFPFHERAAPFPEDRRFPRKEPHRMPGSMDGPAEIHDRTRLLTGGKGSYDAILPGVKRLISRRPGKVPARVTSARGLIDLEEIIDHLLGLGFGSVHVEPAIGSSGDMGVTQEDVEEIRNRMKPLPSSLSSP